MPCGRKTLQQYSPYILSNVRYSKSCCLLWCGSLIMDGELAWLASQMAVPTENYFKILLQKTVFFIIRLHFLVSTCIKVVLEYLYVLIFWRNI